jgi:ABC-type enterochelin transport system substrate-binding protein
MRKISRSRVYALAMDGSVSTYGPQPRVGARCAHRTAGVVTSAVLAQDTQPA